MLDPASIQDPITEAPRPEFALGRLGRGLVLGTVAGVAIYVALGAWGGFPKVAERLGQFRWSMALLGTLLAALNYLLRFLKWEYYLGRLGIECPRGRSFAIFQSGFSSFGREVMAGPSLA